MNEVAEACDKPMLKEKVFALKETMERARRLCEAGELPEERPSGVNQRLSLVKTLG
jgi:hypothetical protein